MSESILQARRLSKVFGRRVVLNEVDLSIPRGAVVGLLGTNGAGKSTLLKCLLGLLKVSSGESHVFGEDSWNLSGSAKSRLGYTPQDIRLYPWMRVRQVLSYQAAFYPLWDQPLVEQLLDRWQLSRTDRVGPLSPGQLQKLGLILALGSRPELLVLDEPVAALDPIARREFLRSLLELTEDEKLTVLFSTHITSDLERIASHVAVLQEGRVTLFDELDAVKDRVKRLRIQSASDLPPTFSVRGALRTEVSGSSALVAVSEATEELVLEIRTQWNAEVAVENLNLEDIFVELHSPGIR